MEKEARGVLKLELEKAKEERRREVDRMLREVEELEKKHQSALSEARTQANQQATTLADQHQSEVRTLREASDADLLATRERLELIESMSSQLDSEKKNLASEIDALNAQLEEHEQSAQEQDDNITALESELHLLRQDYANTSSSRDEFANQLALAEEEQQKSAVSILEFMSEREEINKQMELLTNQMESLHLELEQSKLRQTAKDDANAQRKLRKVQLKLEDTLAENAALRKEQQELQQFQDAPEYQPKTPETARSKRHGRGNGNQMSFDDYLEQAQSELSELGRVISRNESLFAAKIQQHVGDMQHAKDLLAIEYKEKIDAMVAQRAELEEHAHSEHVSELEAARDDLREAYGRDLTDSGYKTNPSEFSPGRLEFQEADTRLVAEHRHELTKRKSQIAIKHALEFQALTTEYDRQIAQLSGDKNRLDSDLSIEPARFERLAGELDAISEQLAIDKQRSAATRSGSPVSLRRVSSPTSLRRVAGSDSLRSVSPADSMQKQRNQLWRSPESYNPAMSGASLDGVASPRILSQRPELRSIQTQRTPTKAESGPHVLTSADRRSSSTLEHGARHSPSRVMSSPMMPRTPRRPSDGPVVRRTVERPRTSEKWASPVDARRNESLDFGLDPVEFERRRKQTQALEAAKHAMAASSGGSSGTAGSTRPPSSSGGRPPSSSGAKLHSSGGRPPSAGGRPASSPRNGRPGSSSRMQSFEQVSPRAVRQTSGGWRHTP